MRRLESKLEKAARGGKVKPLDPKGLTGFEKESDEDSAAVRYWRKRKGTPGGLAPDLAPLPVEPGMYLWLRLDEELLGATDDVGCFHRPESLAVVLEWYREPIRQWFAGMGCPPMSDFELMKRARRMLRCIAAGRADARSEAMDKTDNG